jgi:hypothetical protein
VYFNTHKYDLMNPRELVRRNRSIHCWTHAALAGLQTLTAEAVQSINTRKVERNLFIGEAYTGLGKSTRLLKKGMYIHFSSQ